MVVPKQPHKDNPHYVSFLNILKPKSPLSKTFQETLFDLKTNIEKEVKKLLKEEEEED